jgi:hypothetical protein
MLVIAGVVGVLLGMLNYGLLVTGRVVSDGAAYLLINVAAAVLCLVSLFAQFNLGMLLINAFYLGVSVFGLWKYGKAHANQR